MRKTGQPAGIRLFAVVLAAALFLPLCTPPARAWNDLPQVNAVHVFIGETELIDANESITVAAGGELSVLPASLLYGEVLYLPQAVLQEWGMAFTLDAETDLLSIELQGTVSAEAAFTPPRTQEQTPDLAEEHLQTNLFNILANGEAVAKKGEDLAAQNGEAPSSIFLGEKMLYLPAQPLFQAFQVDAAWDEDISAFRIQEWEARAAGLANFQKTNRYSKNQFTDVSPSAWYADSIQSAFEYGLMNGTSSTAFTPGGNMSVAETITIASRLHSIYYGSEYDFQDGSPWYQAYVDYALEHQLIAGPYPDYSAPISRSEFAVIVGNAFPLPLINEVEDGAIPDVSSKSSYYEAIYRLYRAGILSGTDSTGTFKPDAEISRAEAAAILCGMADETRRKEFTLTKPIFPDSVQIRPASVLIPVGNTHPLSASIQPGNADRDTTITWTSSNPSAAVVSSTGVISGVGPGDAVITATTANGKEASCEVFVETVEDVDARFALDAVVRLTKQLKFPDTLQIYGVWAYDFFNTDDNTSVMAIWIYYSALNPMGLRSRSEFLVFYNLGARTFIVSGSEDSLSSHTLHRPVDISKYLKQ